MATAKAKITNHSLLNQPLATLIAATIKPNSLKLLKAKADK